MGPPGPRDANNTSDAYKKAAANRAKQNKIDEAKKTKAKRAEANKDPMKWFRDNKKGK